MLCSEGVLDSNSHVPSGNSISKFCVCAAKQKADDDDEGIITEERDDSTEVKGRKGGEGEESEEEGEGSEQEMEAEDSDESWSKTDDSVDVSFVHILVIGTAPETVLHSQSVLRMPCTLRRQLDMFW